MPILEECRGSEEVKITFQTYEPAGVKLTYPYLTPDDEFNLRGLYLERTFNNYFGYEIETKTYYRNPYFFGTATINGNLCNSGGTEIKQGDVVYWRTVAAYNDDLSGYYISSSPRNGLTGIIFPNSFRTLSFHLISEEAYAAKSEASVEDTKPTDYPSNQKLCDTSILKEFYERTGEALLYCPRDSEILEGKFGTMPIVDGSFVVEHSPTAVDYFKVWGIDKRGIKKQLAERSLPPSEVEILPPRPAPPTEFIVNKEADTEDIEILLGNNYGIIYRVNVASGAKTLVDYVQQNTTDPPVSFIHNCGILECPENTYQLDCGSHFCCYKTDGYADSRIDKN